MSLAGVDQICRPASYHRHVLSEISSSPHVSLSHPRSVIPMARESYGRRLRGLERSSRDRYASDRTPFAITRRGVQTRHRAETWRNRSVSDGRRHIMDRRCSSLSPSSPPLPSVLRASEAWTFGSRCLAVALARTLASEGTRKPNLKTHADNWG
jgi:hypothetical protein